MGEESNSDDEPSHPPASPGKPFSGLKVAILYSEAKREYFATQQHYITEAEVYKRARQIVPTFQKLGAKVFLLPGNKKLSHMLLKLKPHMALNLVDSLRGKEFLAGAIPGLLETLDIPYTGAGILACSLSENKFLVKKMLEQHGLPVPRYQLMTEPGEEVNPLLRYPLISKLNSIHGSVEIDKSAIVENERQLRLRVKYLMETYEDEEVLVEEFIAGRELTAIVFEGKKRKVYLAEKVFQTNGDADYQIASFNAVWNDLFGYKKFPGSQQLKEDVKKAYEVMHMQDYAKMDLRIDQSGRYSFIDLNVNPAFGADEMGCSIGRIMTMYGVEFPEIVKRLVQNTLADTFPMKFAKAKV